MHSARAGHSHDPSLGKPPRPPGTCTRTRCERVRAKGGHVDEDATPRTWVDRAVLGRARMRRPTRVASPPRHTCLAPADARRRSRACQCVLTWRIHSSQHQPIAPRDAMIPAGLEPAIPGSVGRCLIHWATGPPTSTTQDCKQTQADATQPNQRSHPLIQTWWATATPSKQTQSKPVRRKASAAHCLFSLVGRAPAQ